MELVHIQVAAQQRLMKLMMEAHALQLVELKWVVLTVAEWGLAEQEDLFVVE